MSDQPKSRPSFSTGRRWRIGFDVVLRTLLVVAVLGMVNYLGTRWHHRFYLNSQTRVELSSHTLSVLRSLTNHVEVILYYDTRDSKNFYATVKDLLDEYQEKNSRIAVRTVDYYRDSGEALKLKDQYPGLQSDKDVVVFDCAGRVKILPGSVLMQYKDTLVGSHPKSDAPLQKELEFERKPTQFNGEQAFTSILLALANPQPIKACFLQGHDEASLTKSDQFGYQKFAAVLQQNYISVTNLWLGNTGVPQDCNLLVIAAPKKALEASELKQIGQYLREGGRLLVLFSSASQGNPTGLESLLQNWGIAVMDDIAQDFNNATTDLAYDMKINQFGKHPVVDSLPGVWLHVYLPRPILNLHSKQANAPQVDELFATGPGAVLMVNRNEPPGQYPLACAIEQKPGAGVTMPRGNTRIIVVGDATFLGNLMIDSGGNRDFLNAAVNWLSDRPLLVSGIGPRPVTDLHLQVTRAQQRQLNWLLLAVLPGAVLFFGWLVWLVRRK